MFCSQCGKEVSDNDQFCPNCHAPISGRNIETAGGRAPSASSNDNSSSVFLSKQTQDDLQKLYDFQYVLAARVNENQNLNPYLIESRTMFDGAISVGEFFNECISTHDLIIKFGVIASAIYCFYAVFHRVGFLKCCAPFGAYIVYYLMRATFLKSKGTKIHREKMAAFDQENQDILCLVPMDLWTLNHVENMISMLQDGQARTLEEVIQRERAISNAWGRY